MELSIRVDVPETICVSCSKSQPMTIGSVVRSPIGWRAIGLTRPDKWSAVPGDNRESRSLCETCARVVATALAGGNEIVAGSFKEPTEEKCSESAAALPRGIVPATPLPPYAAPLPIVADVRPKTVSLPLPLPSALPRTISPNLSPPQAARIVSVGNIISAQPQSRVVQSTMIAPTRTDHVAPIPVLVPTPLPPAPPPPIMSKTTVAPAPVPAETKKR
jgi:hypothetical protein